MSGPSLLPKRRQVARLLEAPPAVVRARWDAEFVQVGRVWFPSQRDLNAWRIATGPLFVRWLDDGRFEVGPRFVNLFATRFAPVVRGTLVAEGHSRTRVDAAWQRQPITTALLTTWAVVLAAYLVALVQGIRTGAEPAGALFWWGLLALSTAAAQWLGGRWGGQALEEALPALWRTAEDPAAGGDDWG